jgi:hypothetical protein
MTDTQSPQRQDRRAVLKRGGRGGCACAGWTGAAGARRQRALGDFAFHGGYACRQPDSFASALAELVRCDLRRRGDLQRSGAPR